MARVILVCSNHRPGRGSSRFSSMRTGNPSPPTITATSTGKQIQASVVNRNQTVDQVAERLAEQGVLQLSIPSGRFVMRRVRV